MKIDLSEYEPYHLSSVKALFSVPPPEMIIEGFLPRQSVTGITAYPGIGKTWLVLEIARAIASGEKFLGDFPTQTGNVVYVGQDASVHDTARQVKKLMADEYIEYDAAVEAGNRLDNPLEEHLHFIIQPGFLFENREHVLRMIKTLRSILHSEEFVPSEDGDGGEVEGKWGTDCVIFDTYSSMTRSDQNDNTASESNFRNLRMIADATGAAVILVHHNSKQTEYNKGEDWRGAMSQIAALDNWFHLIKPPRGPEGRLLLKVKKFRGLKPEDFHYYLQVDGEKARLWKANETEEPVVAVATREDEVQDIVPQDFRKTLVLDFLYKQKGNFWRAVDIANETLPFAVELADLTEESWGRAVRRTLTTLVDEQLVELGPKKTYRLMEVSPTEDPDG